jgi:single-strand DNA-binding protein
MANFNKVLLMGNLTRDPEVRYTPKGTAIATIGLAVNRVWSTESGEKKEEVTFVDVDVWGRQAETIGQYMAKGRPIFIEGRLKLDQWDDKESGQKRSKLKVVCESFQFIGAPKGGAGGGEVSDQPPAAKSSRSRPAPAPAPSEEDAPAGGGDDNIPF